MGAGKDERRADDVYERKIMQQRLTQEKYARAIKELIALPCSAYDIAEVAEMHVLTAQTLLRTFKQHKLVHISAWDVDAMGRDVTPIYSFGPGRSVARRRKSGAERQRLSRAKKEMAAMVSLRPIVKPNYMPEII